MWLILLKLSGIEYVTKKVFKVKGVFLNDKKKQVVACARAQDIDAFLLICPLRQVSDDIDETSVLEFPNLRTISQKFSNTLSNTVSNSHSNAQFYR